MAVFSGSKPKISYSDSWDGRSHKGAAFLAGMIAGMGMTITMVILLLLGVTQRSLANFVSDKIAALAGPGVTEFFIQTVGALGKEMLFLAVLIGQVIVGGLLGLAFGAITGRTTAQAKVWRNSFILSTGFWLVFIGLLFPILDLGLLGSTLGNDQISTLIISFMLFQLFGLIFGYSYLYLVPTEKIQASGEIITAEPVVATLSDGELESGTAVEDRRLRTNRRRFVGLVSGAFALVVGAAIGTKAFGPALSEYRGTLGDLKADGTLEGEITPTEHFYQVSKNAFNPKVDGAGWQLEIKGRVNKAVSFTLADLNKMAQVSVYHTLTCISNPVGGDYIGNAKWTGVPFKQLLEQAGVGQGVSRVVFTSADGYQDSITIQKAMESNTILALQMNDAPLTNDHGFPARMLIPNIYGMKNAKWLTSVSLIEGDFEGFWQKQGWDNDATIHTESYIVAPADTSTVKAGEKVMLKGVAFAGSRKIEKVEISFDNGQHWMEATSKERLGQNAWTLWRMEWTPQAGQPKNYVLKVRATEEGGKVQSPQKLDPFPSGSAGYHTISIQSM